MRGKGVLVPDHGPLRLSCGSASCALSSVSRSACVYGHAPLAVAHLSARTRAPRRGSWPGAFPPVRSRSASPLPGQGPSRQHGLSLSAGSGGSAFRCVLRSPLVPMTSMPLHAALLLHCLPSFPALYIRDFPWSTQHSHRIKSQNAKTSQPQRPVPALPRSPSFSQALGLFVFPVPTMTSLCL